MEELKQLIIAHLKLGLEIKPFVTTRWLSDTCLIDKRFTDVSLVEFERMLIAMDGKEILSIAGGQGIGTCWKLMPDDTKIESCLTAPKGKKLVKVKNFGKSDNLSICFYALADGFVLGFDDGFLMRMEYNSFHACINGEWLPLSGVDYHLGLVASAAYRLEDAPWWEGIPEGGIICESNDPIGRLCLIIGVSKNHTAIYVGGIDSGMSVSEFTPVTDQWLDSMKRGL